MPINRIQICVFKVIQTEGFRTVNFVFGAELRSSTCPGEGVLAGRRAHRRGPGPFGTQAAGWTDGQCFPCCRRTLRRSWVYGLEPTLRGVRVAGVVHALEAWACPPSQLPGPQALAGNEDAVCMGSKLLETQTRRSTFLHGKGTIHLCSTST